MDQIDRAAAPTGTDDTGGRSAATGRPTAPCGACCATSFTSSPITSSWRGAASGPPGPRASRLTVRPTVFHPRYFISSEAFAAFIDGSISRASRSSISGPGSGILALAAARAGAAHVVAADINPNAALNAAENARANGYGDRVSAVCSDLLSALAAAAAVRRNPLEPAEACWRTAQSGRSRLACRRRSIATSPRCSATPGNASGRAA